MSTRLWQDAHERILIRLLSGLALFGNHRGSQRDVINITDRALSALYF
jgi:hypothetical protein